MDYIKRQAEEVINKAAKTFPIILVTGPRQVGKTTLLKHLVGNSVEYITFDDPTELISANDEAGLFFQQHQPPVLVDEVQYASNLFPYIKMIADNSEEKGLFYLTGSQAFHLMKNVGESLAGRVCIFNLLGLCLREIKGISFNKPFIPILEYLQARKKHDVEMVYSDVWSIIHRGSMPALQNNDIDWQLYYSSYVKTYIERDVRDLTQVGDELAFIKFMAVVAARTGQMLNYKDIANEVGISAVTASRWLSILVTSGIVYLLQPYFNNLSKRALKTPKLYFLDTGLAAYLTKWNNKDVLENGSMAGAFFETFIISEVIKSYYNAGIISPALYYYRDRDMKEIDLIIEENGILHPIEIKKTANPCKQDIASFSVLDKIAGKVIGAGGIVCLYNKLLPLDKNNNIIPIGYI